MTKQIAIMILLTALCVCASLLPLEAQQKGDPTKKDVILLHGMGTWNFVSVDRNGKAQPKSEPVQTITFTADTFKIKQGDQVVQAGKHTLDASKSPKTIDAYITEGEGKGTTMLGIYELVTGDSLKLCFDPIGKAQPTEFKAAAGSGYLLAFLEPPIKKGVDPKDPSIVYDKPWPMTPGVFAYNGKAYDRAAVGIGPKMKVVLPNKDTEVGQLDQADMLLVFMVKSMHIGAHFTSPMSIADQRKKMGCAVKLEKGALLIGTFGEYTFFEGACMMQLLVLVPAKTEVERRAGLIGGYGGRGGATRTEGAINPTREDPMPALKGTMKGKKDVWLPPSAEDGWHEIPAVADPERRVSKGLNEKK